MAKIYKTNNEVLNIEPKNGTDFQLKESQAIVGGSIELIYLPHNQLMVINKEGHINRLSHNEIATKLCSIVFRKKDCLDSIVGDVLICESNEIK